MVDPQLDIEPYLEATAQKAMRVTYIIETHVQADHVSGARRLAEVTRAPILLHESAPVRFPHVDVYLTNATDLLLVASERPLPRLDYARLAHPGLDRELMRVGLVDARAFAVRRLGGRDVLAAYVRMNGGEAGHSDFYPEVALRAPKARYMDQYARTLPLLAESGLPVLDMVDGREVPPLSALVQVILNVSAGNTVIIVSPCLSSMGSVMV